MKKDVEKLRKMILTGEYDPFVIYEILSHYQDHPAIIQCRILSGSKIIRSSTNDAKEFHESVSRLSYPPENYARTDRASLKGKPMFYGTVFTTAAQKNNAYPRIFSAMETTDLLRDFQIKGQLFTTQSLWLPDRDLQLFAFPFSKKYKRACDEVKMQRNIWENKLSHYWPKEYVDFSEYMGDLIAEENHSCLYEITARTIDYILNDSTAASELDGVMYPSIWSEGEGMNICLKKEVVDECVHFQEASVQYINKVEGESTIVGVAESYLLPNGKLKWIPTTLALNMLEKSFGTKTVTEKGMIVFDSPNN